jgi:hypothetical protein
MKLHKCKWTSIYRGIGAKYPSKEKELRTAQGEELVEAETTSISKGPQDAEPVTLTITMTYCSLAYRTLRPGSHQHHPTGSHNLMASVGDITGRYCHFWQTETHMLPGQFLSYVKIPFPLSWAITQPLLKGFQGQGHMALSYAAFLNIPG